MSEDIAFPIGLITHKHLLQCECEMYFTFSAIDKLIDQKSPAHNPRRKVKLTLPTLRAGSPIK
jgi:hypothetical protein